MIEEVSQFNHLGYMMTRNNSDVEHVKEKVKKARMAMGKICSIGDRKFRGDIKWRSKLFDAVIKSILIYGSEVWG